MTFENFSIKNADGAVIDNLYLMRYLISWKFKNL